jgi:hypothetical protein
MDTVANAHLFWAITEQTLVELYGWNLQDARDRVASRRGRMTKAAIVRNLVYHNQPLHVADDLARNVKPLNEEALRKYDEIVARLRREASGDPSTDLRVDRQEQNKPGDISAALQLAEVSLR